MANDGLHDCGEICVWRRLGKGIAIGLRRVRLAQSLKDHSSGEQAAKIQRRDRQKAIDRVERARQVACSLTHRGELPEKLCARMAELGGFLEKRAGSDDLSPGGSLVGLQFQCGGIDHRLLNVPLAAKKKTAGLFRTPPPLSSVALGLRSRP